MSGGEAPWAHVPERWELKPLFAVADERRERNTGMTETNLLSLSYGRIVPRDIEGQDGLLPASFETYQIVEPGDIVCRFTDLQNDKRSLRTGLVTERGIITSAYTALTPRCLPRWMSYLLRAYDYQKVFYGYGGGVRQSLKFTDVRRLPVLIPPEDQQRAIVNFLDRETAQIDAMVDAQERLVALLEERRSAVVADSVTKGLSVDVPLRRSGIDWLGDIPGTWATAATRYLCEVSTGEMDTVDADPDADYPFFVRSQTVERASVYTHDCEAVLTAGDGAGVGQVFHHVNGKFAAHQRVYIYRNFRRVLPRYYFWYLSEMLSRVTLAGTAKSTVPSLRRPMLTSLVVTVPPVEEQARIVAHLDRATARIDTTIAKVQESIALMKERRAAVISAAVTGRLDVRTGVEQIQRELEEARA